MNPSAGWFPDPRGRHEHRYWDGSSWTDHVSDHGDAGIDRLDGTTRPLDEVWAEEVESSPADAETILPAAAASDADAPARVGAWRRVRGLPVVAQALSAAFVVAILASALASGDGDGGTANLTAAATTTSTGQRVSEVTSAPPTTTTTEAPTTTATERPTTTTTQPPTTTAAPPITTAPRPTTPPPTTPPTTTAPPTTSAPRALVSPTTSAAPARGNCHPAYPDDCIPPPPPDLNCPDIGHKVRVDHAYGDPHRLDSDNDGWGCESYG